MYKNNMTKNESFKNNGFENEGFKNIIETFDGIRKDNSRIIFGILLSIITIDVIMDCYNGLL
jgi:hypothetical protein